MDECVESFEPMLYLINTSYNYSFNVILEFLGEMAKEYLVMVVCNVKK